MGKIGIREEVLTKSTRLPLSQLDVIGLRLSLRGQLTGEDPTTDFATLCRINRAESVSREDAAAIARLGAQQLRIDGRGFPLLTEEESNCLLIPRGNLTPAERLEIERHPAESYRILQHIPFPKNMKPLPVWMPSSRRSSRQRSRAVRVQSGWSRAKSVASAVSKRRR